MGPLRKVILGLLLGVVLLSNLSNVSADLYDAFDCQGRSVDVIVSRAEANRSVVNISEHVSIAFTLQNLGTDNAIGEILDFFINEEVPPTRSTIVNISAGGETISIFDWDTTVYLPGAYKVMAKLRSNGNNLSTDQIMLLEVPMADLVVDYLITVPEDPTVGDLVEVQAQFFNDGTADADGVTGYFLVGAEILQSFDIDVKMFVETVVTVDWDTSALSPRNYTIDLRYSFEGDTYEESIVVHLAEPAVYLEVQEVTCEPSEVHPGELVRIKAKVLNKGQQNASDVLVTFYDGAELLGIIKVDLPAGTTKDLLFTHYIQPSTGMGVHTIEVRAINSRNSTTLLVKEKLPEKIFFITLSTPKDTIGLGDIIPIKAVVNYTGQVEVGNVTLVLRSETISNIAEQNISGFLPGQTKVVMFNYTGERPGTRVLYAYIPETGESNQISILVKDQASISFKVSMTIPQDKAVLKGTSVVKAQVQVPWGLTLDRVELWVDGERFGDMTPAPFMGEYIYNLETTLMTEGKHELQAVAITTNGLKTESKVVDVTVDNIPGVGPSPDDPGQTTVTEDIPWFMVLMVVLAIVGVIIIVLRQTLLARKD